MKISFSQSVSTYFFKDDFNLNQECSSSLFNSSSSLVGRYQIKSLIEDYYEITNEWFNELSIYFKSLNINLKDSERFEGNKKVIVASEEVLDNAKKIKENLNKYDFNPISNILGFGLIGVNKNCFLDSDNYKKIFNWGVFEQMFNIDKYTISTSSTSTKNTKRKLERSLSILNNEIPRILEEVQINTLNDLHSFAASSLDNFLLINKNLDKITKSLLIISFLFLFFLSLTEYIFTTTSAKGCCKILWMILGIIFIFGQLICMSFLTIAYKYNKSTISNITENSCFDKSVINLLNEEIWLNKYLYLLAFSFVLIFIELLFGILYCVMIKKKKYKHRFWKPIPIRLA